MYWSMQSANVIRLGCFMVSPWENYWTWFDLLYVCFLLAKGERTMNDVEELIRIVRDRPALFEAALTLVIDELLRLDALPEESETTE